MGNTSSREERKATWMRSSSLGVAFLLATVLLVMVNYLGARHYKRVDWTRGKLFTLSEKTLSILDQLDEPIDVVVFMNPGEEQFAQVRELLARYDAASSNIRVQEVDPVKNLAQAQKLVEEYDIQRESVIVFKGADDRRVVESVDLADYDYSGMQMGQAPQATSFKGEQLFTSAILELQEKRKPRILFTTGHDEAPLDDSYAPEGLGKTQDLLGRDNFHIEEWQSLGAPRVPEGTDLVVIAGPQSGFTERELEILTSYLEEGGRILIMLDPLFSSTGAMAEEAIQSWLAGYGVLTGSDVVVDPGNLLPFFSAETIFADNFGDHPVTRSLSQAGVPVVFALAGSVRPGGEVEGVAVTELVSTSPEGWAETDLENLQAVELGEDDLAGPVSMAVALEWLAPEEPALPEEEAPVEVGAEDGELATDHGEQELEEEGPSTPARMIVVGDSDFAANGQIAQAGNATFVVNIMNWLVEREALLGIPPKMPEQVRLNLSSSQMSTVRWIVLALLPGLAVVAGIYMTLSRRR